ncbi:hypothetical protein PACTADRAFT_48459, partial [Pachysolen tannophilus NRRL Y-2460]
MSGRSNIKEKLKDISIGKMVEDDQSNGATAVVASSPQKNPAEVKHRRFHKNKSNGFQVEARKARLSYSTPTSSSSPHRSLGSSTLDEYDTIINNNNNNNNNHNLSNSTNRNDEETGREKDTMKQTGELATLFLGIRKGLMTDLNIEPDLANEQHQLQSEFFNNHIAGQESAIGKTSGGVSNKIFKNENSKKYYEFSNAVFERANRVKITISLYHINIRRCQEIFQTDANGNPLYPNVEGVYNPLQVIRNRRLYKKYRQYPAPLDLKLVTPSSQVFSENKKHKLIWQVDLKELAHDLTWRTQHWHHLRRPDGRLWFPSEEDLEKEARHNHHDHYPHHHHRYYHPSLQNKNKMYEKLFEDKKNKEADTSTKNDSEIQKYYPTPSDNIYATTTSTDDFPVSSNNSSVKRLGRETTKNAGFNIRKLSKSPAKILRNYSSKSNDRLVSAEGTISDPDDESEEKKRELSNEDYLAVAHAKTTTPKSSLSNSSIGTDDKVELLPMREINILPLSERSNYRKLSSNSNFQKLDRTPEEAPEDVLLPSAMENSGNKMGAGAGYFERLSTDKGDVKAELEDIGVVDNNTVYNKTEDECIQLTKQANILKRLNGLVLIAENNLMNKPIIINNQLSLKKAEINNILSELNQNYNVNLNEISKKYESLLNA